MMKTLVPLAVLALAVVVHQAMPQTPQTPQPTATGVIEGTFMTAGTAEPVAGVSVMLNIAQAIRGAGLSADQTMLDTTTDEMGHFIFKDLYPGNYQLRYQIDGYFPVLDGIQSSVALTLRGGAVAPRGGLRGGVQGLAFVLGTAQPVKFDIQLAPGGVISGRVADSNGRPIINGQVSALYLTYNDGMKTLGVYKTSPTNDRGDFRLFGLEPGAYYVRAEYRRAAAPGQPQDQFRAYFPGVSSPNDTSPIAVRSGTESSGINIAIRPVTTVKVSGMVTLPPSLIPSSTVAAAGPAASFGPFAGAASAAFYLEPLDAGGVRDAIVTLSNSISPATDRAAGKFELRGVLPGRYDLYTVVRTDPANAQERHVGRATINVGNQDLDGVNLVVSSGADLRARFTSTDPAAASQAPQQLQIRMKDALVNAIIQQPQQAARGGNSAAWRTYSALPEGQYVLDSPLATLRDAYVAEIRQGDHSIYETGTVAVSSSHADDVEVILARPAAAIDGTVVDAAGKAVSTAAVVLIPNGDLRQNRLLYKRSATGADGTFTLRGLAPGTYKLFAWDSLINGGELNADFLKDYEERGVPVTLAAGAQLKLQIPVILSQKPG